MARYTGLLETVRIRRAGYATRLPQVAFVERYAGAPLSLRSP